MSKQNLIIYKYNSLYNILEELDLDLNFKIFLIESEKLLKNKIADISKNKDILKKILKEEILKRYYYQEGVYLHNLKNDTVIKEAVLLLQNQEKYRRLLSAK